MRCGRCSRPYYLYPFSFHFPTFPFRFLWRPSFRCASGRSVFVWRMGCVLAWPYVPGQRPFMSYDPTCKVWKRRYETNLDPDDELGPVEYEVRAKFMRWSREDSDYPPSRPNVGRILQYRPLDQTAFTTTSAFRCPPSAGTATRSSPGWRRTCERFAIQEIKEQLHMGRPRGHRGRARIHPLSGELRPADDGSYRLQIKAAGPWECVVE